MSTADTDKVFTGSIPRVYDEHLVPLIFEPYAQDIVSRLASRSVTRVLEIAAGTGVVTRKLAAALPANVDIVATDLNQAMLDQASLAGTVRPVQWQQADAMDLPFGDATFDAVICQFGVMFFPDKGKAFAEMRRVLMPGGVLLFNVWDRIEENEIVDVVTQALAVVFPADPPRFMQRSPHGYHDVAVIRQALADGGFTDAVQVDTVAARSKAPSARFAVIGYCQGSPLRTEIEARGKPGLDAAVDAAVDAVARKFGDGAIDCKIQAHVVTALR